MYTSAARPYTTERLFIYLFNKQRINTSVQISPPRSATRIQAGERSSTQRWTPSRNPSHVETHFHSPQEDDPPKTSSPLCVECQSIFNRWYERDKPPKPKVERLWHERDKYIPSHPSNPSTTVRAGLRNSAQRGCPVCRIFLESLDRGGSERGSSNTLEWEDPMATAYVDIERSSELV